MRDIKQNLLNLLKGYKLLYVGLFTLLFCSSLVFSVILFRAYQDYRGFKIQEEKLQKDLSTLNLELEQSQSYIKRFHEDTVFFDWVVRQRLGFSDPDEIIFRFDED